MVPQARVASVQRREMDTCWLETLRVLPAPTWKTHACGRLGTVGCPSFITARKRSAGPDRQNT
jgi:hypothetical protein